MDQKRSSKVKRQHLFRKTADFIGMYQEKAHHIISSSDSDLDDIDLNLTTRPKDTETMFNVGWQTNQNLNENSAQCDTSHCYNDSRATRMKERNSCSRANVGLLPKDEGDLSLDRVSSQQCSSSSNSRRAGCRAASDIKNGVKVGTLPVKLAVCQRTNQSDASRRSKGSPRSSDSSDLDLELDVSPRANIGWLPRQKILINQGGTASRSSDKNLSVPVGVRKVASQWPGNHGSASSKTDQRGLEAKVAGDSSPSSSDSESLLAPFKTRSSQDDPLPLAQRLMRVKNGLQSDPRGRDSITLDDVSWLRTIPEPDVRIEDVKPLIPLLSQRQTLDGKHKHKLQQLHGAKRSLDEREKVSSRRQKRARVLQSGTSSVDARNLSRVTSSDQALSKSGQLPDDRGQDPLTEQSKHTSRRRDSKLALLDLFGKTSSDEEGDETEEDTEEAERDLFEEPFSSKSRMSESRDLFGDSFASDDAWSEEIQTDPYNQEARAQDKASSSTSRDDLEVLVDITQSEDRGAMSGQASPKVKPTSLRSPSPVFPQQLVSRSEESASCSQLVDLSMKRSSLHEQASQRKGSQMQGTNPPRSLVAGQVRAGRNLAEKTSPTSDSLRSPEAIKEVPLSTNQETTSTILLQDDPSLSRTSFEENRYQWLLQHRKLNQLEALQTFHLHGTEMRNVHSRDQSIGFSNSGASVDVKRSPVSRQQGQGSDHSKNTIALNNRESASTLHPEVQIVSVHRTQPRVFNTDGSRSQGPRQNVRIDSQPDAPNIKKSPETTEACRLPAKLRRKTTQERSTSGQTGDGERGLSKQTNRYGESGSQISLRMDRLSQPILIDDAPDSSNAQQTRPSCMRKERQDRVSTRRTKTRRLQDNEAMSKQLARNSSGRSPPCSMQIVENLVTSPRTGSVAAGLTRQSRAASKRTVSSLDHGDQAEQLQADERMARHLSEALARSASPSIVEIVDSQEEKPHSRRRSSGKSRRRQSKAASGRPVSPDVAKLVQQLDEDEAMARRLQEEYDSELARMTQEDNPDVEQVSFPHISHPSVVHPLPTPPQFLAYPHPPIHGFHPWAAPQPMPWRQDVGDMHISSTAVIAQMGRFLEDNMEHHSNRHSNARVRRGRGRGRNRSRGRGHYHNNMVMPMPDGSDYEALLNLAERVGPAVNKGLPISSINLLPTFKYSPGSEVDERECSICMSDYEAEETLRRLPCFHFYHAECIDKWFKDNQICPVCREEVRFDALNFT